MVKHRRLSDKPKDKPLSHQPPDDPTKFDPNADVVQDFSATPPETTKDLKSIIQSGLKYIYIIAAAALLSGIFTPLTINAEITTVVYGMLTIFIGLGGGISIFLGIKNQRFSSILICGGLGMMIISLILIYELAGRSIL
jgi:hypothetical protein